MACRPLQHPRRGCRLAPSISARHVGSVVHTANLEEGKADAAAVVWLVTEQAWPRAWLRGPAATPSGARGRGTARWARPGFLQSALAVTVAVFSCGLAGHLRNPSQTWKQILRPSLAVWTFLNSLLGEEEAAASWKLGHLPIFLAGSRTPASLFPGGLGHPSPQPLLSQSRSKCRHTFSPEEGKYL